MKKLLFLIPAAGLFLVLTNCVNESTQAAVPKADPAAQAARAQAALVKRGEYLVNAIGCDDCHSPKKFTEQGPAIDETRRMAGHPADEKLPDVDIRLVAPGQWALFNQTLTATVGPWGVSFSSNLTPDPTGIGNWTEANFVKAIREGKLKGLDNGRPLLPPMPWTNYARLTDDDLSAIFAYLKTLTPVRNVVPLPIPPDQLAGK